MREGTLIDEPSFLPPDLQRPVAACCDRLWDLVVVGAGPAGALAARQLAAAGYRVLLLERSALPREKICGDALLPDALALLETLGLGPLPPSALNLAALAVYSPGGRRVELPCASSTLRRRDFDAWLVAAAAATGTVLAHGEAVDGDYDDAGLPQLRCRDGSRLRGRFLLLATGAGCDRPRWPGLARPGAPDAVALRCYLRAESPLDHLVISYHRGLLPGYGWIFPLGDGLFNVGCGRFGPPPGQPPLRQLFAEFLAGFAPAREFFATSERTPLRGAPLRTTPMPQQAWDGRRVLVAGEALGTTLPFTGEGVGRALASGLLASELLGQALAAADLNPLAAYARRLRTEVVPCQPGYRQAQDWLQHPLLAELLAWRARRSPYLRSALGTLLAGSGPPGAVFSGRALLRSCWS